MPPKRARNTKTKRTTLVQETTEQISSPVQESKRPNMTIVQIKENQEWDLFSKLINCSNTILEEQPAKNVMSILASTFKTPLDVVSHQLEFKKLVIKRVGVNIIAHHVDNPSFTLTMRDLSEPVLWVNMLIDIFTQSKVPSPLIPAVSHRMQLVLALCARLPPITKLVIHKKGNEIDLNIIGQGFDAIVRIVGEQVLESRRFPQLCVPWRKTTQPNTALGTQIIMIPDDSIISLVEIVPTPAGGYIGTHNYGVGGFMCLSKTDAMVKYRLSKPTLIMLNTINPSLMVLKTPNSSFHGVVERIEKKDREYVWLEGGRRFSWNDEKIDNLDNVLSKFSQQGRL